MNILKSVIVSRENNCVKCRLETAGLLRNYQIHKESKEQEVRKIINFYNQEFKLRFS